MFQELIHRLRSPSQDPTPSTSVAKPSAAPEQHPASSGVPKRGKRRYRRLLVFWHVSTHPTRSDAFQFAEAARSLAWSRDNIETVEEVITERADGRHQLDLTWAYGPVVGGFLSDGERFLRRMREKTRVQPLDELPLEVIEIEKEAVAD